MSVNPNKTILTPVVEFIVDQTKTFSSRQAWAGALGVSDGAISQMVLGVSGPSAETFVRFVDLVEGSQTAPDQAKAALHQLLQKPAAETFPRRNASGTTQEFLTTIRVEKACARLK